LSVVSGGQVREEGVEELDDRCLAVKVMGPNNSRQQDKSKGSVRGGGGAVLDNNIEEAGGHWVKLFLPAVNKPEPKRERRASSSKGLGTEDGMRRSRREETLAMGGGAPGRATQVGFWAWWCRTPLWPAQMCEHLVHRQRESERLGN
jgi:hypothetical protein